MKRLAWGILLTVVLSVLAGAGGALIGARYVFNDRHKPSLHELVHEELDLTAEQERRLQALEHDFAIVRQAREAEMRAANKELAQALLSRHAYSPEVQAAVERFHHAMGELQRETILHVLAMRQLLTPQQAARFDQRMSEALVDESP